MQQMFKLPPHKPASLVFDMHILKGKAQDLLLHHCAGQQENGQTHCASLCGVSRRSGYSSNWNIFFFCDMKFWIPGISEVYIFMFNMFCIWKMKVVWEVYNVSEAVWTYSNQNFIECSDEYTVPPYRCKIFSH